MALYDSILGTIGNTPHVRFSRLYPEREVYCKLEGRNPGGAIKDRIALSMIEDAEAAGTLKPGMRVVEPTSGNTGIGLALVCAVKGYKLTLVMPEHMSVERRRLMSAYGATFVLTPKEGGMKAAIARATELKEEDPENVWIPNQFENPANPAVHERTTAAEIAAAFRDKPIDVLITGVGTGGHISGCARFLKRIWPKLQVIAVEPTESPVLSGGKPGPHRIMGIGAGFVPGTYDASVIDKIITVTSAEAMEWAVKAAATEGYLCGISSGASLAAVAKALETLPADARVLTFQYDTGERYLSVEGLFQ